MDITVTKNGERIATYTYKHAKKRETLKALKAFYSAVYSNTKATLKFYVGE